MARVPCEVHPTESFYRDASLLDKDGLEDLAAAVELLEKDPPDLPVRATGWYGDTFGYVFRKGYLLTFRRVTERDEKKQPERVHLYLKRILRDR